MKKYFGDWEKATVPTHEWRKAVVPAENQVILVDRPASVQSVMNITYPIELQYKSPDRISPTLLTYILGGGWLSRLFMNLRDRKGYTYCAYSCLILDRISGNFIADASVRTEVNDSAA